MRCFSVGKNGYTLTVSPGNHCALPYHTGVVEKQRPTGSEHERKLVPWDQCLKDTSWEIEFIPSLLQVIVIANAFSKCLCYKLDPSLPMKSWYFQAENGNPLGTLRMIGQIPHLHKNVSEEGWLPMYILVGGVQSEEDFFTEYQVKLKSTLEFDCFIKNKL